MFSVLTRSRLGLHKEVNLDLRIWFLFLEHVLDTFFFYCFVQTAGQAFQ